MSTALQKAGQLQPEIRLAQAISDYEHILTDEEKPNFRILRLGRPPEFSDVMRLTAQIDQENSRRHRRCVGPRLTKVLEAVQQFSTVIDVIIGGSQSLMASAIWGVLKTALLIALGYKAYFDKLSVLFMQIGRTAPHYQDLSFLFPSVGVRKALCEYFTSVVLLCKEVVIFLRKGLVAQLSASFLKSFENEFGRFQRDLSSLAGVVHAKVSLAAKQEQKQELKENSAFRNRMSKVSEDTAGRRRQRNKQRFLDACSRYDYTAAWRQARKAGPSAWLYEKAQYRQWVQSVSGTLLCTGILGSGKTVLAANLVEHLTITNPTPENVICYFFCKHDEPETLSPATILRALIKQMLNHASPEIFDTLQHWDLFPFLDDEQILEYFRKLWPLNAATQNYWIVLDGLDECKDATIMFVAMNLWKLMSSGPFRVFCSCRQDTGRRVLLPHLRPEHRVSMEVQPDLAHFIEAELEERLQCGELCLGDPGMILHIRDALVNGSHGMFLWVVFQLDSICAEPTDEGILGSLQSLPKDLPETFNRILRSLQRNSQSSSRDLRREIFEIIATVQRPLTIQELREALSVVPGRLTWDGKRLVNDMNKSLGQYCGSLTVVNEEEETVHFIHPSIRQHLLSSTEDFAVSLPEAEKQLGELCATYLNFPAHEKQLVSTRGIANRQFHKQYVPATMMVRILPSHTTVNDMAIKMLRTARGLVLHDSLSVNNEGRSATTSSGVDDQYPFLRYATKYWPSHTKFFTSRTSSYSHFCRLLTGKVSFVSPPWEDSQLIAVEQLPVLWAAETGHEAAIRYFLERPGVNANPREKWGCTPLSLAAVGGHETVVKFLVTEKSDVEVDSMNMWCQTPLWHAASGGYAGIVDILLDSGRVKPDIADNIGRTPLQKAASLGYEGIVRRLLVTPGVEADARDRHGRTPLRGAAEGGYGNVVQIFLERGDVDTASRDEAGWTPLSIAAFNMHEHVVDLLEVRLRLQGLPLDRKAGWGKITHASEPEVSSKPEDGTAYEDGTPMDSQKT